MRVLAINTYGGSLLLGARALGLDIIGSYEDTAFGLPIQQANFPDLDFRPYRKDWPVQDLSEVFVIAHPPCSAFSVMTNSKDAKGVNSKAFACTKSVLQYCVDNKALGFAIESVVPAMAGAWPIHQYYADTYGYNIYRILENGAMFGAQWRDRFWVVYVKQGAAPDVMPWTLYPKFQTVRQVVGELSQDEPSPAGLDAELAKLKTRFIEQAGCSPADMDFIFNQNVTELTSVDDLLWQRRFGDRLRWDVCKEFVTKWASGAMVMLHPDGTCPVLLGGSWWHMDGRNLTERGYKRLMGFPADYVFPEGDGSRKNNYRADFRTYLSKGVMPPIAEWVLANSLRHLGAPTVASSWMNGHPGQTEQVYSIELPTNDIADFRIRRKTWGQTLPALRHWDENRLDPVAQKLSALHGNNVVVTIDTTAHSTTFPLVKEVKVRIPRPPRVASARTPRVKTVWNSPEVEASLAETLFTREHTADKYALYESHGYHRMNVRAGDVVLDLGAHIGCVASRAALVGAAQVVSVEPEPANYELLVQNTRSFQNVETINAAVTGDVGETTELHRVLRHSNGGHSTGTHSCTFRTRGDTITVPRLDFCELLERYQPTVIKCDTEGGELGLDWTALPPSVRSIGIELHTQGGKNRERAKEIIAQLAAQGFAPVHKLNMESCFSAIIAFLARPVDGGVMNPPADGPTVAEAGEASATVGTTNERTNEGANDVSTQETPSSASGSEATEGGNDHPRDLFGSDHGRGDQTPI